MRRERSSKKIKLSYWIIMATKDDERPEKKPWVYLLSPFSSSKGANKHLNEYYGSQYGTKKKYGLKAIRFDGEIKK